MIVVSDSSPLIALSRVGCLDLLSTIYPVVQVPEEVYSEVVITGAGLPGAQAVSDARWIQVAALRNQEAVRIAMDDTGLGAGETAVVQLAQELGAEVVLIDDRRARRFAEQAGLICFGCIGVLEMLFQKGLVTDLQHVYRQLLEKDFRIGLRTLHASLTKFGLPPI